MIHRSDPRFQILTTKLPRCNGRTTCTAQQATARVAVWRRRELPGAHGHAQHGEMPPCSATMRCMVLLCVLCRAAARYELGEGTYKDHVLTRASLGARSLPAEHWALLKAAVATIEPMADRETLEPLIAANERFFDAVATPHEAESAALQAAGAVPLLVQLVRDWYVAPQPRLKRCVHAYLSAPFPPRDAGRRRVHGFASCATTLSLPLCSNGSRLKAHRAC